jgi:predicted DNA-binding transcriptional regulator AlpA
MRYSPYVGVTTSTKELVAMVDKPNDLMKTTEVAAALGKHPQELSDWRHQGRGPAYVKLGRSVRYRPADIAEFIDSNIVEPNAS